MNARNRVFYRNNKIMSQRIIETLKTMKQEKGWYMYLPHDEHESKYTQTSQTELLFVDLTKRFTASINFKDPRYFKAYILEAADGIPFASTPRMYLIFRTASLNLYMGYKLVPLPTYGNVLSVSYLMPMVDCRTVDRPDTKKVVEMTSLRETSSCIHISGVMTKGKVTVAPNMVR